MVDVTRIEIVFKNTLQIAEVAPPQGGVVLRITFEQFTITAKGEYVMYTLPVDHTVLMQIAYVDVKGNPATVDNEVAWQSSDVSIVTVTVDTGDTAMCRVTPVGSVGQVQVTAICDADLGEGVRNLVTLCDIEIVGGEAVAGTIQPVGEPDPIEPHAAPR